jgi:hypothetical protein
MTNERVRMYLVELVTLFSKEKIIKIKAIIKNN